MNLKYMAALPLAVALLALTSCRTSQGLEKTNLPKTTAKAPKSDAANFATGVIKNRQASDVLTARINMKLDALGKDLSAGGTLRMKRDEVVQLSLTFLGFEVGRMEFTPNDVLIIDRVNKQYVKAKYSDVNFLKTANLDFYALQSLFWNELFVPGQKNAVTSLGRYSLSENGTTATLSIKDAPRLVYSFSIDNARKTIGSVTVQGRNASDHGKLVWKYGSFKSVEGKPFPSQMSVSVTGIGQGKSAGFDLSLSRFGNSDDWEKHTEVSSKYVQRDANQILGKLLKISDN